MAKVIDFEHKKNKRLAVRLLHTMKSLTDKVLDIVEVFDTDACYFLNDEIESLIVVISDLAGVEVDRLLLFQFLDGEMDADYFIKVWLGE